jgi:hypothetical protein
MATVKPSARANFDFPASYINEYLYEQFSKYSDINMAQSVNGRIPFFPAAQAVNISDIYQDLQTSASDEVPAVLFYDRMIRLRSSAFPIGKREQVLYTVYGSIESCNNIGNVMLGILDREDYSAQDLNKWMSDNKASLVAKDLPMKVFFRSIRVFQADESQDLVELDGYRRGSVHKYIVEYDYHLKDNIDFLEFDRPLHPQWPQEES